MTLPDYCTANEIKAALPDGTYGNTYDTILGVIAGRASREFDALTNRSAGAYAVASAAARYFDGSGGLQQWVDEFCAAPTEVAVDETGSGTYATWATTYYELWPYNALDCGTPYTRLDINTITNSRACWYRFQKSVKVTAKWGYSATVPGIVKDAVIIMAARLFQRGRQAFADTGAIAELGQLTYVRGIDPQVDEVIRRYRRVTL